MLAADKRRLRIIDNCCREILLCVRESGEDYGCFAKNETVRQSVFADLHQISGAACGLSLPTSELLKGAGFRVGYLESLRFWTEDTKTDDERKWRAAWEICTKDCMDLLLFAVGLLQDA